MRIAFVTPEYVTEEDYYGGLANYLYRIAQALLALGHESEIFVAAREDQDLVHAGVRVHRVRRDRRLVAVLDRLTFRRFGRTLQQLGQSWALNRAVKKVHRRRPFLAVQCTSYMATGILRNRTIPTVVRISSQESLWRREYQEKQSGGDHAMSLRLDRWALQRADGLYAPSRLLGEIVAKETGKPVAMLEPPFLFEPGPLNDEIFRNRLSGKRYLLFFGAVGLLKGVAVIAEIIDELLCQYEGLFFVLIGQDKGYRGRPMMEHLWNRAGKNRQRVLHLGIIPHPCLYPILQNAHAVVLPSLIDNLPNTCLEAMALRRVVIGTRGASFEQLIEDGRSGFLAEKNSGPSLLEKIRGAMDLDDCARKAMGDCARERILKLSPERAATELIAFLDRVSRRPFFPCGGCEAK